MERTYDLRLPKPAPLMVAMDSPTGVHASNTGEESLCGLPLTQAETLLHGTPEVMARLATCPFCQARLVTVGVLDGTR
jgi:hypothetical protein